MIKVSKKLMFLFCLITPLIVVAKKTKKLQLIVNPADPQYFFALNDGTGINHNPGTPRPQGSYYITNAFIFPGGTVSKNQSSYLVDKDGNPLDFENGSLGIFYTRETMLQTVDFGDLPAEGTVIETSDWQLQFSHACDGLNALFATGFSQLGIFTIGQGDVAFEFFMAVIGGLGCNENVHHNNCTGKVYIAENGQSSLIKIKFDEEIEYHE
jgi:hypothetical protein